MNLSERITEVESMLTENKNSLAITIPVHTLEILLAHCKESLENKSRANYYKEQFLRVRLKNTRLRAEVKVYATDQPVTAGQTG